MVAHGKQTQNQFDVKAENRAVRADTERQRENGDAGEHGTLSQKTTSVANVAQKIVEPEEAALVAQCFHGLRDAARVNHCRPSGTAGQVAPPLRVLAGQLQMQSQFLLELA